MKKHFYTHLVEIESVLIELDKMELDDHEKLHLASLVDANLHNAILDTILAHLSEHDKNIFLKHLTENDHERIWQHLNIKIESIEDKIKKAADGFRKELHEDINRSQKLKVPLRPRPASPAFGVASPRGESEASKTQK